MTTCSATLLSKGEVAKPVFRQPVAVNYPVSPFIEGLLVFSHLLHFEEYQIVKKVLTHPHPEGWGLPPAPSPFPCHPGKKYQSAGLVFSASTRSWIAASMSPMSTTSTGSGCNARQ